MHQIAMPPIDTAALTSRTLAPVSRHEARRGYRILRPHVLVEESLRRSPPVDQLQGRDGADEADDVAERHEAAIEGNGQDLPLVLREQIVRRTHVCRTLH